MNRIDITTEDFMKGSLIFLHFVLALLVVSVLVGRESPIIGDMFSATLMAIVANLGAISGNKALQKFVDNKTEAAG